jgi:hypothetical protein
MAGPARHPSYPKLRELDEKLEKHVAGHIRQNAAIMRASNAVSATSSTPSIA